MRLPSTRARLDARHPPAAAAHNQQCDDLLHLLGNELGFGALEFDERHNCILKFDDVVVQLHHSGDQWLEITGAVAVLVQPPAAELLAQLLATNAYWRGASGCTLALDVVNHTLLLQDRLPVQSANLAMLTERLEALIDCVERWRGRLTPAQALPMPAF
jgi:hypothetical protein